MDLKIKLLPGGKMPRKATDGAACYDLHIREIIHKTPFYVVCMLGITTEFSPSYKMPVLPRSSISKTGWVLANSPGIIDSDYRGEWQAHFRYLSTAGFYESTDIGGSVHRLPVRPFPYKVGERCAQTCPELVEPINFISVEEFTQTTRGTGGHGSTGK